MRMTVSEKKSVGRGPFLRETAYVLSEARVLGLARFDQRRAERLQTVTGSW